MREVIRANGGREPSVEGDGAGRYLRFDRTCLLCPAPGEDVSALRTRLAERGRIVHVIDPERDVLEQLAPHTFWKG